MRRHWPRIGREWNLPEARFPETFELLQENGDELLQEDGNEILTEEAP